MCHVGRLWLEGTLNLFFWHFGVHNYANITIVTNQNKHIEPVWPPKKFHHPLRKAWGGPAGCRCFFGVGLAWTASERFAAKSWWAGKPVSLWWGLVNDLRTCFVVAWFLTSAHKGRLGGWFIQEFGFSNICLFIWTSIWLIFGMITVLPLHFNMNQMQHVCRRLLTYWTCHWTTWWISRPWHELSMPWFAVNILVFGKRLQTSPFQIVESDEMHPAVHQKDKPCW